MTAPRRPIPGPVDGCITWALAATCVALFAFTVGAVLYLAVGNR